MWSRWVVVRIALPSPFCWGRLYSELSRQGCSIVPGVRKRSVSARGSQVVVR